MDKEKYWFPAKPPGMGLGWGPPVTWQGWVVFIGFFVLLIGGTFFITPYGGLAFALWTGLLAAALMAVCFIKGEPLNRGGSR